MDFWSFYYCLRASIPPRLPKSLLLFPEFQGVPHVSRSGMAVFKPFADREYVGSGGVAASAAVIRSSPVPRNEGSETYESGHPKYTKADWDIDHLSVTSESTGGVGPIQKEGPERRPTPPAAAVFIPTKTDMVHNMQQTKQGTYYPPLPKYDGLPSTARVGLPHWVPFRPSSEMFFRNKGRDTVHYRHEEYVEEYVSHRYIYNPNPVVLVILFIHITLTLLL
jgi:hypothetical protein